MNAIEELQRILREEGTHVTDSQAEAIARRVSSSVEAYLARRREAKAMNSAAKMMRAPAVSMA